MWNKLIRFAGLLALIYLIYLSGIKTHWVVATLFALLFIEVKVLTFLLKQVLLIVCDTLKSETK